MSDMSEQSSKQTEPIQDEQNPQPVPTEAEEKERKAQIAWAQRNYDYHHKQLGFMVSDTFWR